MSSLTDTPWVVLKFGGTSVSTSENWNRIAEIVREKRKQGKRVCLVHSALSGISNMLEAVLVKALEGRHDELLQQIREYHLELAESLGLDAEQLVGRYLKELRQLATGISLVGEVTPRLHAQVLSLGELMSTTLGAAYLEKAGIPAVWVDARTVLTSESIKNESQARHYVSAMCSHEADPQLQERFDELGPVVLTQGFIASDSEGATVLLGRGGSDVSGALFAAHLEAEKLEIWTDVPGMFTADPRLIPASRLIRSINYEEAQEIATTGAKVLHPRCILPVQQHGIPLEVCCTPRPELEGTLISEEAVSDEASVKAISMRKGVILVTMETVGMWQQVGFLADAFAVFKQHGLSIDLVSTSETSVTVSLDPAANPHFHDILDELKDDLSAYCRVNIIEPCTAISLVGRHIRAILHQLGPTLELFEEHRIYLLSQASNDLNFTFVVDEEQAPRLVRQLHELLIGKHGRAVYLGPSWEEIFAPASDEKRAADYWWKKEREQLLQIGVQEGASYVYHRPTLQQRAEELKQIGSVDRIFYAIKANAHPEVLRTFYEMGLGFECVSPGEIAHVRELFPGLDPDRILFTPNFAPREEYAGALEQGLRLTVDNLFVLRNWPELFRGREIFIRVDPGKGRGHHEHVVTGGTHSKFGIPLFEMDEVVQLTQAHDITVRGLHAHSGSGILHPENWRETALTLAEVAKKFPAVEILDLGGGLGIKEQAGQIPLDLEELDQTLAQVREAYPHLSLWLEPGRFLVAEAGVLLARVTQLKGKGNVQYLGLNTGMNSLIRPALYGSYHGIVNLSRLDEPARESFNVVGPICESGDRLGSDRMLPAAQEGDVMLIANAGAYGRVMSSHYNMRAPAEEEVIG